MLKNPSARTCLMLWSQPACLVLQDSGYMYTLLPASMPCAAGQWLHVHPAALCLEMLRSEHFFRKGYPVNINSNPVRSCQPARGHGRSGCQ